MQPFPSEIEMEHATRLEGEILARHDQDANDNRDLLSWTNMLA